MKNKVLNETGSAYILVLVVMLVLFTVLVVTLGTSHYEVRVSEAAQTSAAMKALAESAARQGVFILNGQIAYSGADGVTGGGQSYTLDSYAVTIKEETISNPVGFIIKISVTETADSSMFVEATANAVTDASGLYEIQNFKIVQTY